MVPMTWYALKAESQHCKAAATADESTRGGRINATLRAAGYDVLVPIVADQVLLRGYVLIRPVDDEARANMHRVKTVPGVLGIVTTAGVPDAVSIDQVAHMERLAEVADSYAFDISQFRVLDEVSIGAGPLKGFTGVLLDMPYASRGKWHLLLGVGSKRMAVAVNAREAERVRKIASDRRRIC